MTTNHTPGPWNHSRASAAGRHIVCSETSPVDICVLSNRDKTEKEIDANARLIAAAPELLAALEQITRTPALSNGALLMQDIARAAIARAKGAA